jgi:lysozyme
MDMSLDGLQRLMKREGMKLKAYRDSGGVLTICVGHTSAAGPPRVKPGMTCTKDECLQILRHDVSKFEDCVESAVRVPMEQHEFDALVSLAFNIGCSAFHKSSALRYLNKGDRREAANRMLLWNKVKGKTVKGLTTRRQSEREQFLGWDTA